MCMKTVVSNLISSCFFLSLEYKNVDFEHLTAGIETKSLHNKVVYEKIVLKKNIEENLNDSHAAVKEM